MINSFISRRADAGLTRNLRFIAGRLDTPLKRQEQPPQQAFHPQTCKKQKNTTTQRELENKWLSVNEGTF